MQVGASQQNPVQAEFSTGISKKALDTSADLVNNLMSKSLEGTANQARASQGVGTKLNTVA